EALSATAAPSSSTNAMSYEFAGGLASVMKPTPESFDSSTAISGSSSGVVGTLASENRARRGRNERPYRSEIWMRLRTKHGDAFAAARDRRTTLEGPLNRDLRRRRT